jgi:tRNA-2-methylthio-N6-dimethylallyladenosine synthase
VLEAMNRHYTRESYLELVGRLRAAMPDIALSSDIIVGFPGETEDDFDATLDVVTRAGYDQVFTFIYSPRKGTPAASMVDPVPGEVTQERFERLVALVHSLALENNRKLVGSLQEVLFEGPSKRNPSLLTGRTPGNKVVHVELAPREESREWAGRFATVRIESAQTWFLNGRIEGTNIP